MKKGAVKSVKYNFRQMRDENGMDVIFDYELAEIGKEQFAVKDTPTEIIEREPMNGLQKHMVDIKYKSGAVKRVFNLCEINYFSALDEVKENSKANEPKQNGEPKPKNKLISKGMDGGQNEVIWNFGSIPKDEIFDVLGGDDEIYLRYTYNDKRGLFIKGDHSISLDWMKGWRISSNEL
jgi:hypothetical protein